ncbi:MAG: type VII toxin-antitoxin system MntA family adenylyltransferase antitoxin [Gammaproteobacteria bacterium]
MTKNSPSTPDHDPQRLAQVAQKLGLRMVVLFGSRATGRPPPGPDSDIDIAVLGLPEAEYWDCLEALQKIFPNLLDMVRLEETDPLFRHEVMHKSVLLWGEPDRFYEFRAYAYRDFTDAADLFALERVLFAKKMQWLRKQLGDPP